MRMKVMNLFNLFKRTTPIKTYTVPGWWIVEIVEKTINLRDAGYSKDDIHLICAPPVGILALRPWPKPPSVNKPKEHDKVIQFTEQRYYRANGDCRCPVCGAKYKHHLYIDDEASPDFALNLLCNGERVKL